MRLSLENRALFGVQERVGLLMLTWRPCPEVRQWMSEQNTILVVEDNDFVRTQIVRYLKDVGYKTTEASDGDSAFALMSDEIALAIVDVRMEPVGGFEFIRLLQQSGYNIPVVLVTGDQDHDLLQRAGQHGVGAVLLKPVKKDRLVSMVGRMLQKSKKGTGP